MSVHVVLSMLPWTTGDLYEQESHGDSGDGDGITDDATDEETKMEDIAEDVVLESAREDNAVEEGTAILDDNSTEDGMLEDDCGLTDCAVLEELP